MLKLPIALTATLFVFTACDQNPQLEMASSTISSTVPDQVTVKVSPDQICSDITYTDVDGNTIQGRRNCKDTRTPCKAMGDTFCMMEDANLYGVIDKNLTEQNIKKGITFFDKTGKLLGNLDACTEDGQADCIIPENSLSMSAALLKAHVVKNQVVAGVKGEYDPGFPKPNEVLATDTVNGVPGTIPACAADGETACRADSTYRAVNQSELLADRIRSTVTLGGVTGTYTGAYGACTADNQTLCISTPDYISLDKTSVDAARVRSNIVLAGITGSLVERSANCAADGAVGCTTTASYPAADFGQISAANIKNGVTIGGINGLYPSATHKLTTDTPAADLAAGNFDASIASTTTFEYWDAAGNRYTGTGDGDLVPANILTGTSIFGVTGNMSDTPAACSDTLSLSCVASATHVAFDASKLTAANIKTGVTLGNADTSIEGLYPSATHPLVDDSVTVDLTAATFDAALASAASFEYWDAHGTKYTATGSTDLVGTNIVTGKTLFGVAGNLATRPSNCADGLRTACVTTASFPSYDPAILAEGVIKSGVTIADVTGKYPSITYKLAGSDTTLDLTQGNFASQLHQATTFEYFDSEGQRYTGQGDTLLAASHLRSGTNIHGVTGNIVPTSAGCTAGNQTGCVANSSYPAFRKADLTAAVVKNSATVMGIIGTYPSAANRIEGSVPAVDDLGNQADLYGRLASGDSFEFWGPDGTRYTRSGDTDLTAANIVTGTDLFGVSGSLAKQPSNCSSDAETGCLASTSYPAFDKAALTEGLIKNGTTIGGILGKYPSATYTLPGASAGTADLTQTSFAGLVSQAGSFEYWDAAGTRHTQSVATNLQASQILAGKNIFGVNGGASLPPPACSATSEFNCITNAAFPSHRPSKFTPGLIKAGATIGATTGQYPSNTYPLAGNQITGDLTSGNFDNRIKNDAAFEYWDGDGNHHTGIGSATIVPDNIKKGVSIFGVSGNRLDPTGEILPANQIRYGVTINGILGTLKLNCRNGRNGSDVEVDDYVGGLNPLPGNNQWGAAHDCSSGIFEDLTSGTCDAAYKDCVFQDKISGLRWSEVKGTNRTWNQAKSSCGSSWRIPTIKELFTAYSHGFRDVFVQVNNSSAFPNPGTVWSATTSSYFGSTAGALSFNFDTSEAKGRNKENMTANVLCVQ